MNRTTSSPSPLVAVCLAGGLRPSPLQVALGMPALHLPLGGGMTLGRLWLEVLAASGHCAEARVVVSRPADLVPAEQSLGLAGGAWPMPVSLVVDAEAARGTAGVMRDVTRDLSCNMRVLGVEVSTLPPQSIAALMPRHDGDESVLIATGADSTPAGLVAVTAGALDAVPRVGFCDLKEQFIAQAVRRGVDVRAVIVSERTCRLRDRAGYIAAVTTLSRRRGDRAGLGDRRDNVVAESADVHPEAIVISSVVMDGATIGAGAVVARSIVAPGTNIRPGARVIDTIAGDRTAPGRLGRRRTHPAGRAGEARRSA